MWGKRAIRTEFSCRKSELLVTSGGSELDGEDNSRVNWTVMIQDQLMWKFLLTP